MTVGKMMPVTPLNYSQYSVYPPQKIADPRVFSSNP